MEREHCAANLSYTHSQQADMRYQLDLMRGDLAKSRAESGDLLRKLGNCSGQAELLLAEKETLSVELRDCASDLTGSVSRVAVLDVRLNFTSQDLQDCRNRSAAGEEACQAEKKALEKNCSFSQPIQGNDKEEEEGSGDSAWSSSLPGSGGGGHFCLPSMYIPAYSLFHVSSAILCFLLGALVAKCCG